MNIAIYETIHLDWVIPLAKLLNNDQHHVTFFVSAEFASDLKGVLKTIYNRFKWIYVKPNISSYQFYVTFQKTFSKTIWDVILLNSVDSKHFLIYLALTPKKKSKIFLNIHDVNNFFDTSFDFNFKHFVRSTGKTLLRKLIDAYIVNACEMKYYIETNRFTSKPVFWFPPVIFEPQKTIKQASEKLFTVLISGSIEKKRRNYDIVLEIIQEFTNDNIQNIRFIFAGKPVGDFGYKILKHCEILQSEGSNINFFKEEVPEVLFQNLISECSVILSPLHRTSIVSDDVVELYGITKSSGNVYDAIRHAKPIIIPSYIKIPEGMENSCIIYNSKSELKYLLNKLISEESTLNNYQKEAINYSKNFMHYNMQNKLLNILMVDKNLPM